MQVVFLVIPKIIRYSGGNQALQLWNARKGGDLARAEPAGFVGIVGRMGDSRNPAAQHRHQQEVIPDPAGFVAGNAIQHFQNAAGLGMDSGFLGQFADCCLGGGFADFDQPAGEAPQALVGVTATPDQQDLILVDHYGQNAGQGVLGIFAAHARNLNPWVGMVQALPPMPWGFIVPGGEYGRNGGHRGVIRLIRSRLSYKVAVAASALTLFFVVVMGVAAYMVMSSLTRAQVNALLEGDAALRAEKLSDVLDGISHNFRTLANNAVVTSALADATGRDIYLGTLLKNVSEVNGVPVAVAVTDYRGRVLVESRPGDGVAAESWIGEIITRGSVGARIIMDRQGPSLVVAEPVVYRHAGQTEGALVYRIALRDLARRALTPGRNVAGELVLTDGRRHFATDLGEPLGIQHALVAEEPVRLPAILKGMSLAVRVGALREAVDEPLARLASYFLGIGALATLVVLVLAVLMGQRLTMTLRRLSDISISYAFGVSDRTAFQIEGSDEIARLGTAFAGMIERLDRAYQDLERRSQTLLSNAERVAQVGSAGWDLRNGEHLWSGQFHAILGLDPEDSHPGLAALFDRIHPDDRERVSAALDTVIEGDGHLTEDFRIVRADGEERVGQLRAQLARDDSGEPARVDLTLQDISERKHMEERFDTLVRDLRRSNEELEQFAYVASHDLRQPLRVVRSYVTLIEDAIEHKLDAETREFMDFIRDGVRRMDLLITDLLAYSRVGRTSKDGPVDMGRAMDLALIDLQVEIDDAAALVRRPEKLPVVMGDSSEMTRLFQNLIGNGVKYRAADRQPAVEIGYSDCGAVWEFFVQDNGIGIPPEHLDRVFGIFQRLHARDEYEGTGIGLAICKKIVERQAGRIWIESCVGNGTTFRFTWPKLRRVTDAAIAE